MNAKASRVQDALRDAGQSTPPVDNGPPAPTAEPTPKRTRAPELVQAALRRDIRLLNERMVKLTDVYDEKMSALRGDLKKLQAELDAVTAKLDPGTNGDTKGAT